jgi:hypothetical protein
MRRGEALNLRWDQVDLRAGGVSLGVQDTKTGRARDPRLTKRTPHCRGSWQGLPRLAQLPYGPASCGRLLDERRAAWACWAELEPRLGGSPVGAESALDFGAQLIAMKRNSERVARGATWVSSRVANLALLEGCCANEETDWARALGWLDRAISMRPASPEARIRPRQPRKHREHGHRWSFLLGGGSNRR